MIVVGVDGCKAGWLAAELNTGTSELTLKTHADFRSLLRSNESAQAIAVDIPIGLADGPRLCDTLARQFVGPRRSSVFPTPCRSTFVCRDYRAAATASLAATGRSLSQQAFAIMPKIREVDELMTPDLQSRVREVHPEVCFRGAADTHMQFWKRDSAGFEERRMILSSLLPEATLPSRFEAAGLARGAAADDVLDAVVAAWSASRMAVGNALTLPGADIPVDAKGLRMEMVY